MRDLTLTKMKILKIRKRDIFKDYLILGLVGIHIQYGLWKPVRNNRIHYNTFSGKYFALRKFDRVLTIILKGKKVIIEF